MPECRSIIRIVLVALALLPGLTAAGWEVRTVDDSMVSQAELARYDLTLPRDGAAAAVVPHGAQNLEYATDATPRPHLLIRFTPRRKSLLDATGQRYLSPMLFGEGFLDTGGTR